jgi:hypothetical protein
MFATDLNGSLDLDFSPNMTTNDTTHEESENRYRNISKRLERRSIRFELLDTLLEERSRRGRKKNKAQSIARAEE